MSKCHNIKSKFGSHQVIKEPAHILDTFSWYADLICTSVTYLIIVQEFTESYIQTVIHQILYTKFNLHQILSYIPSSLLAL